MSGEQANTFSADVQGWDLQQVWLVDVGEIWPQTLCTKQTPPSSMTLEPPSCLGSRGHRG